MSRVSPETYDLNCIGKYYNRNPASNMSASYIRRLNDRSWSSVKSPGYPKTLQSNPYALIWKRVLDTGYYDNYRSVPWTGDWDQIQEPHVYGAYAGPPVIPSTWPYMVNDVALVKSDVINRAINGAIDRVKDQSVNFGQVIAERQQTVRLIEDTVQRLTKCIVSIKKGRPGDALAALGLSRSRKRFTGNVADQWLAMQYGWKPLLSDIHGSAEHLAKNMLGRPIYLTGSKSAQSILPMFKGSLEKSIDEGWYDFEWSPKEEMAKCKLNFQIQNDFIRQGVQLGLTDPLTLAWELLPWSFVVDWFIPVGNFINRLNYTDGLSFKDGTLSTFTRQTVTVGPRTGVTTWKRYGSPATLNVKGRPFKQLNIRSDRIVYSSPPRPTFPVLKDPFSVDHVLNALALMRSQFRVR